MGHDRKHLGLGRRIGYLGSVFYRDYLKNVFARRKSKRVGSKIIRIRPRKFVVELDVLAARSLDVYVIIIGAVAAQPLNIRRLEPTLRLSYLHFAVAGRRGIAHRKRR